MERINKLGIDIGSTTVKVAIMDTEDNILYSKYERHFANIQDTLLSMIKEALEIIGDCKICPVITGSGGLSLSSYLEERLLLLSITSSKLYFIAVSYPFFPVSG